MRTRLTISVDYSLYTDLKKLSEITRIPTSRLFDEAVEDLLHKHNFQIQLEEVRKYNRKNFMENT